MTQFGLTYLNNDLLVRKAVSPQRETTDGLKDVLWGTLDGALVGEDWIQALVMDGRVFHAYFGNASSNATFATSWANTDPDITVDVPAGTTVIPLRITVVYEEYGTDALAETMTLVSQTLGAASAGTKFTPLNYRLRHTRKSNLVVYTAPTVTSGYTGTHFELYRACNQLCGNMAAGEAGPPNKFEWSINQEGIAPMIEGNAQISTWAVSNAPKGFIQWVWAEIPTLPYA